MKRSTGRAVRIGSGGDAYQAFVPAPLPPHPPLKLSAADHDRLCSQGTSEEAISTTRRILALFAKNRRSLESLGRAAASAFRVHELPTEEANNRDRIVKELTGFKRNRVFAYAPYVELLSEGTEPIR